MTGIAYLATCVAIDGRAVLIEGPPGAGKSSLALALIDRGATLVSDDGVLLTVTGGRVHAHPHPRIAGLLEVRNLGLVSMPTVADVPVALVLALDHAAERYVESAEGVTRAGCRIPLLRLWPESPVLALRAELALARYGLPVA
ncbi:HPr kinase/phosphorylase [Novosphingobium sp.]|uniref:HPr kinase/phosphorylase n=1 Tax=Novosphingobium sp. TaxID=1874826 RepID=UPI0025EAB657|nr:HPr kinase/phosphatase C-terminal domain-containing protein [Novosphingobium sp.]